MDCAAITSLRTGAAAAVSAQALARDDARTVGLIGCGVNGAWAARCLAAAGYGPGVCFDPRPEAAEALAAELGWSAGDARGGGGRRRRRHRHPGRRAGDRAPPTCARASTWRCSAPTRTARPRSSSTRSRAAGCSATSGSRRRRAASSPGPVGAGDRRRASEVTEIGDVLLGRAPGRGGRRRDHALRLDRARDPGPRDRARGARRAPRGPGRGRGLARRSRRARRPGRRARGRPPRRGRRRRRPSCSGGGRACRWAGGSSTAPCGG